MLKVYWFKVYYPRGGPHVNVQIAPDLDTAYAQERRSSIEIPLVMNARYPRQPQPVASQIAVMREPTRAYLQQIDPRFLSFLDEACRVMDTPGVPSEAPASVVPQ